MKNILYILLFISSTVFCQHQTTLIASQQQFANEASFDIDYQNYLNRLTTLTYTLPTPQTQILQNQLVLDLKTAGVWNKADLISLFATDGDSNSSLVNLYPSSSYQCVTSGTVTFSDKQGWYGNGTDGQIFAEYNFSTDHSNFTLNSNCSVVYLPEGNSFGKHFFGCYDAPNSLGYSYGSGLGFRNNTGVFGSDTKTVTSNLLGMRRSSNTSIQLIDGSTFTTKTSAAVSIPNKRMGWIGRDGSTLSLPTHKIAFGWVGAYLTNTELSDMKIALDIYYNSL